ncbi:MAG: bifunctional riboflavin kinase/FAD synthetase [Chloroflexi bacterium]|nr:bifunctional riboflavin kinase/FAD synthetase [Chloroflexota bacterium]
MNTSAHDVVATLGAFDGVHRAHQALLRQVVDRAHYLGVSSLCVTFHPHPDIVLYPERKLTYLTDRDEKERLIRALGIHHVLVLAFTRELSMLRPDEFIDLLQSEHRLVELWLGPDAAFGRGRSGTLGTVAEIARAEGFALHVVPPVRFDHEVVSSTLIRSLLSQGEVEHAARLLGRPYRLAGEVVEGARRGRQLGFPTANLRPPADATLPADGVYAAWAWVEGARHGAAVNLGGRPTFGEAERIVEVHLLDYQGDLYGQPLAVDFVRRLRGVQRFPSVDALAAQIRADAEAARAALSQEA